MHTLIFLCFLNYVGDCSSSDPTDQAKVDARITSIIDWKIPMLSEAFALSTQASLPGMINFGTSVTSISMKIQLLMTDTMVLLYI